MCELKEIKYLIAVHLDFQNMYVARIFDILTVCSNFFHERVKEMKYLIAVPGKRW